MYRKTLFYPVIDRSTIPGLALCGVWFAGVSLGLLAACFYGGSVGALALTAGRTEPTFFGCCVATVLPLFLSAFAVFLFHRTGAYFVSALRGFILGYTLGCVTAVGGIWLGLLLLFSAVAVSPVLLWFLWRRLSLGSDCVWRDLLYAFLAVLAICAVDFRAVAPFLAHALSF